MSKANTDHVVQSRTTGKSSPKVTANLSRLNEDESRYMGESNNSRNVRSRERNGTDGSMEDQEEGSRAGSMDRARSSSMSGSQRMGAKDISVIRKKRETDRLKQQAFFRNQKQMMISKKLEQEQEKLKTIMMKENKRKKRHEEIKTEIVVFKQQLAEEKKTMERDYNQKMLENISKRQEEIKNQVKGKTKALVEMFKEEEMRFKEKENIKMSKLLFNAGKSQIKESRNEKYQVKIQDNKAFKEMQAKVMDTFHSMPIKAIFTNFEEQLEQVYDYYSSIDMDPYQKKVQGGYSGGALFYRNFFAFANQFNIMPRVIDDVELKVIYKTATNGRLLGLNAKRDQTFQKKIPIGLTYEQFKEMLFRITIKKQAFFEKVVPPGPNDPPYDSGRMEFVDIMNRSFHNLLLIENEKDDYSGVDTVHYSHMEGMLYYLALPTDKKELQDKMLALRREYHKKKPDRLKRRIKKEVYERFHKVNEVIKEKRGPTKFTMRQSSARSLRQSLNEKSRDKGLANKRLQQSTTKVKKPLNDNLVDDY